MTEKSLNLLKQRKLRVTDVRIKTLQAFLMNSYALGQPDLERLLGSDFDRVTLYRTLNTLVDNGLLHKVPDNGTVLKYAICHHECCSTAVMDSHNHLHQHSDDHVHFKCNKCDMTMCLPDTNLPKLALPDGFKFTDVQVLIAGLCDNCNRSA